MKSGALVVAVLAVTAALAFARPHPTPGPALRDFEAYYAGGATWLRGADPYSVAIWQSEKQLAGVVARRFEVLPFVAPPATLPIWAAFSLLPFTVAANVWRASLFICLAALLWILAALANLPRATLSFVILATAALGFGPITSALALGQLALPVALAITAAVAARGMLAKALAAAVACMQPNLALVLAGHLRERKGAAAILGGAIFFAIVCIAIVGFAGIAHYIAVLQQHGAAERFSAIQITPAAVAYGFGASPGLAAAIGTGTAIAAGISWLMCLVFVRDRLALFCATCALVPFVSPFFHEHDFAIVFAPALLIVLRVPQRWLPAALVGALLCATDWLGLAQRPDGFLQTMLLAGAFAIVLLILRERIDWRATAAVIVVLVALGFAGFAARAHPLPIWPDAMAPLGPAARSSDIAAIWHSEQAATGLFVRDQLWALLRCASLAGSALLAYVAVICRRS